MSTEECFMHLRHAMLNRVQGAMSVMAALVLAGLLARNSPAFVPKSQSHAPLALHPANPHYFQFRGKATVLITSAEHYGAVLNRDFDYKKYLDELHVHGLNLTRTFTGVYAEDAKAFGIARNTLAPTDGKLICPWPRSSSPGYAGGGNKFDLAKWDP